MIFSCIRRPGMKLVWAGEMRSLRIGLTLFAIILVITLYVTLHKAMGRIG
ncbi:uncharacterized protein DS421_13g430200 [Arachis hypogaea]|nr:uncharacterized protein DS421_13g430200 [Arachis hypogaea]